MADTTVGFEFDACAPMIVREDESALIADLCTGVNSAYETLIDRFENPVFNIVSRVMDDPADAADVVQEVFLKIFRNVGSFRQDSSLKTWIYRIAVNEARNHRRWFSRHRRQEVGLEAESGESQSFQDWLTDPGPSPFETALDRETRELIEAALIQVNPRFRAALVLREMEGLSYEEIAEILEISLGTVKSRILRGRDALKKQLSERLTASGAVSRGAPEWAQGSAPRWSARGERVRYETGS